MAIKAEEFTAVGEALVDSKERVTLSRALRQIKERFGDRQLRFAVALNESTGVIVLTPVASVPLRELWLHENPEALRKVQRGLAQAGRGAPVKRGSFAKHANDKIE